MNIKRGLHSAHPVAPGSVRAVSLLKAVPLFASLSNSTLEQAACRCRWKRFKQGEAVFRFGESGYELWIIATGRVSIQKPTASGKTLHVGSRFAGECFGELALIDGQPRMADAVAASACELLAVPLDLFQACLAKCPPETKALLQTLVDRLRAAADHLESHRELDTLGRVAQTLLSLAQTGGAVQPDGSIRITSRVTHQQLADMTGASRETVTRALASLRETGAVQTVGGVLTITRPDRLRACALG